MERIDCACAASDTRLGRGVSDLSPSACQVGSQMEAAVGRGGRQSVGIGAEEGEVMDGGGVTEAGSLGFSKQPMDHMGTERPLMCYMGTGCSS